MNGEESRVLHRKQIQTAYNIMVYFKGNYIRQYPKSHGNKNVSFSVGY